MREDSAPEVETEPISSWLKRAMQFTLPSRAVKLFELAKVAMASTAQYLLDPVSGVKAETYMWHTMRIGYPCAD